MSQPDSETLHHRRQFVLGPQYISGFPSWKRLEASPGLRLTAHPEVSVDQASGSRGQVTVLGLLLNPREPQASAAEVAAHLAEQLEACAALDDFGPYLTSLAGRWAVVATLDGAVRVFHDAAGTRQLFYPSSHVQPSVGFWCASSAHLLVTTLGDKLSYELDPEVQEVMDSEAYRRQPEYWWPGNRTPYRDVRRLVPNHFLDGATGATGRENPIPSKILSLEDAATNAAQLLRGTLRAAAARRRLAVSLTAGLDSRVTLAACRAVAEDLYPFSFVHAGIDLHHPDVRVPGKLLRKHGLEHHVFSCPASADTEFDAAYRHNNPVGTASWAAVAEGFIAHLPPDVLRVTSVVSEVGRCFYQQTHDESQSQVDATTLAGLTRLGDSAFVLDAFKEWLDDVPPAWGGDILDLFYWEQRIGSWAGALFSEWDIAHDGFSPFSCGELLTTFLAVEEQHRRGPTHALHHRLVELLWPELLDEPINPPRRPSWKKTARRLARGFLRRASP